jgi:hypothetical protein
MLCGSVSRYECSGAEGERSLVLLGVEFRGRQTLTLGISLVELLRWWWVFVTSRTANAARVLYSCSLFVH